MSSFCVRLNNIEKGNEGHLIDMDSASCICSADPGIIDFDEGFHNHKRVVPSFLQGYRVSLHYGMVQE